MRPNLPIAFASVLLSVMLWFVVYVQNVPEPKPVFAPLTLDGLDDTRFFVRKVPTDVRLVVNAPADRIKDLTEERVTASVDLSSPKPGLHDYPLAISPDRVRRYLDDAHPTVRIDIEPMDSRLVRVTSLVKGALRDSNLQLTGRRLSPPSVTVLGPASEVAAIQEVRAYLDLADIDPLHPEAQESVLVPLDAHGGRPEHVRTNPATVLNSFKIAATPSTKPAQIVPDLTDVTYDRSVIPGGYHLEKNTVLLSGKPAVLANVSKIPMAVHARGLARTRTVRIRLTAPEGTTIVGSADVEVTLLVRPAPAPVVAPSAGASVPDPSR